MREELSLFWECFALWVWCLFWDCLTPWALPYIKHDYIFIIFLCFLVSSKWVFHFWKCFILCGGNFLLDNNIFSTYTKIFLPILYTTWDNHSICWSHGTSPRTLRIIQYYVGHILNKNQNIYLASNNLSLSQKSHPYWIQLHGEWNFCWVGLSRIPTTLCFLVWKNNGYVLTLFQSINLPTKVWFFL
jgi:hypothetical protein